MQNKTLNNLAHLRKCINKYIGLCSNSFLIVCNKLFWSGAYGCWLLWDYLTHRSVRQSLDLSVPQVTPVNWPYLRVFLTLMLWDFLTMLTPLGAVAGMEMPTSESSVWKPERSRLAGTVAAMSDDDTSNSFKNKVIVSVRHIKNVLTSKIYWFLL